MFDAYGTLLELDDPVGALRRGLAAAGFEYDARQVANAFRVEVGFYRSHQDQGSDGAGLADLRRRCAATFAAALPSAPPPAVAMDVLTGCLRYRLFEDVVPTLDALDADGVRCAVVSNWDCSLADILGELGIVDRFAAVTVSALVGARKPDRRIFERSLQVLGIVPGDAVHVGDDPALDVDGAVAAGISVLLLDRTEAHARTGPEGVTTIRTLSDVPERVRSV
jgi:FMN phosphatase YigB (HAD superfamily)